MKKILGDFLLVAFTFVMVLSLTGCGDREDNNDDSGTPNAAWFSNEYA